MENCKVLVIYDSDKGATKLMAQAIREGASRVHNVIAEICNCEDVDLRDMISADAFAFGSPNHFGSMSAKMKLLFRKLRPLWEQGALRGRPASVFTASGKYHGGAETALLTLMFPLFAHGMLLVGVPPFPRGFVNEGCYLGTKANIDRSKTDKPSEESLKAAAMLGERLARTVLSLKVGRKAVKEIIVDQKKKPNAKKKCLSKADIAKLIAEGNTEAWECSNCSHIHHGEEPPVQCPICNLGQECFIVYNVDAWECTECGFVIYSEKPENNCPVCNADPKVFIPYRG